MSDRTKLAAAAANNNAQPVIKLLVDYGDDGFASIATWTDESAYVLNARGEMASTGTLKTITMLGQGIASVCYATLWNEVTGAGARFSPTNTAGPLYASIGEGKIRMMRAQVKAGYYPVTAVNFILNPGFEIAGAGGADVFASWTEAASDGTITDETTSVHSELHACKLVQGAAQATAIYQNITVESFATYSLKFWTRGAGGFAGRYWVYDVTNAANIIAVVTTGVTGNTYTQVSTTFAAPAGCVLARLYFMPGATATTIAYFDNVSVREVPIYTEQITGYIVDSTENYTAQTVTLEIRDRAAALALMQVSTDMLENKSARQLVTDWLALQDRDPLVAGNQEIDLGVALHRYAWLDKDGNSLWGEMGRLAEAHGGRVWMDRTGVLQFEDMAHQVKPHADTTKNPLTSQATFTTSSFAACDPRYPHRDVINHVILKYAARYAGPQEVIATAPEVYVVPPNTTLAVVLEHDGPTVSVIAPVAYDEDTEEGDFWVTNAGRANITGDCTVVVNNSFAMRSEVTLDNNNVTYAAYFVRLQLRGIPLLTAAEAMVEVEDAVTSIPLYGRQTWEPTNPYIANRTHAASLAEHVLARFKSPPLTITLRNLACIPYLEPGNRVTVTETDLGINTDFFLTKLAWTWAGAFTMNLDMVRCSDLYPYTNYFIVGTNKWGDPTHPNPNALAGRLAW